MAVIICTTVVASLFSLLDILVTKLDTNDNQWKMFATVLVTSIFTTFSNEWSFLPSVILATTAVNVEEDDQSNSQLTPDKESEDPEANVSYQQMKVAWCECKGPVASIGMQYGALISCLDFGDQIGSWLTLPLVAALGISRANDWENMGTFILTTALLSLMPLALLPIIRNSGDFCSIFMLPNNWKILVWNGRVLGFDRQLCYIGSPKSALSCLGGKLYLRWDKMYPQSSTPFCLTHTSFLIHARFGQS
jgi:hypothetical protein